MRDRAACRLVLSGSLVLATLMTLSMLAAPSQSQGSTGSTGTTAATTTTTGPGPAKFSVSVQLSPPSIVANGNSTTTAIATITDAAGHPVPGQVVSFSSSDRGDKIGSTVDFRDGTYTTTIISSTMVGMPTITAVDSSVSPIDKVAGSATLTQAASGSTTSLLVPKAAVTNQSVTLIATVASTTGGATPLGEITFFNGTAPILGCVNDPVDPSQSGLFTCQTSFAGSTFTEHLMAVFTPASGASVAGSQSALDDLHVGRDSVSTEVDVSNPAIVVGGSATYTATVTPNPHDPGPVEPSGSVEFLDGGKPISACAKRSLVEGTPAEGNFSRATCMVRYRQPGTHEITASYLGDGNFIRSAQSTVQPVHVRNQTLKAPGIVTSTMQWTFLHTPTYTKVLALLVNHAPVGGSVLLACRGGGCPFGQFTTAVTAVTRRCAPHGKHGSRTCTVRLPRTVNLVSRFRNDRLRPGASFTVEIVRPRSIGKYYRFAILAGHAPRVEIRCLAPGSTRPGIGC